eukprot:TRINITY_DN730_c0_g1_i1.p1 TRINITY_DN730_c0_g1~~TRINITY_DN730_c0_g1_i1.p1  ORF type:complete len:259 (-),score=78.84 TRINITY_DN730_c0_g1_i1:82-858(-)
MKRATFMEKLRSILEDASLHHLVRWMEYGASFEVSNPEQFASQVLPRYFKHANFSSFIRQLHGYGFHKKGHPDGHVEFYHSELADPSDMKSVQRKYNTTGRSTVDVLRNQVDELKEENLRLQEQVEMLQKQMQSSSVKHEAPAEPASLPPFDFQFGNSPLGGTGSSSQFNDDLGLPVSDFFYNNAGDQDLPINVEIDFFSGAQNDVKYEAGGFFSSPQFPSLHRIPSLNDMDGVEQTSSGYGYTDMFADVVDKYAGFF